MRVLNKFKCGFYIKRHGALENIVGKLQNKNIKI